MVSVREWALSLEDLKSILNYNPETGVFTWLIDYAPPVKVQAGDRAGNVTAHGYRVISIASFQYQEARLAFFYMTGKFPVAQVDHINGTKDDNRWSNLREATPTQNRRNQRKYKNNTTGYKGVTFHKRIGKYQANTQIDGKRKHLGYFQTAEEASAAYEEFAKSQFGDFYPDKLTLQ